MIDEDGLVHHEVRGNSLGYFSKILPHAVVLHFTGFTSNDEDAMKWCRDTMGEPRFSYSHDYTTVSIYLETPGNRWFRADYQTFLFQDSKDAERFRSRWDGD